MSLSELSRCVFCMNTNRIIDFVPDDNDGTAMIAKFTPEYGMNLVVLDVTDAYVRYENACKSSPVEITEDRWHDMLGVLPPFAWKHDATGESFKLSERTAGSITAIFVRIGDRYFELSDTIMLPHRECVARVRAAFFAAP